MSQKRKGLGGIVGRRVRTLRRERGWDQVDLEAHIHETVGRSAISHFETGRTHPSLNTLVEFAQAFDVDAASLLLDPHGDYRHRVAIAVLACRDDNLLKAVGKLLDVPSE